MLRINFQTTRIRINRDHKKMERTVNQILDFLTSNYRIEEIVTNNDLSSIHKKLIDLKMKYSNGGILGIKNSNDLIARIAKYKLAV